MFGNNSYLNAECMAMSYTNVSDNEEHVMRDDYNFFHSQLRLRVECCFDILFAPVPM